LKNTTRRESLKLTRNDFT